MTREMPAISAVAVKVGSFSATSQRQVRVEGELAVCHLHHLALEPRLGQVAGRAVLDLAEPVAAGEQLEHLGARRAHGAVAGDVARGTAG